MGADGGGWGQMGADGGRWGTAKQSLIVTRVQWRGRGSRAGAISLDGCWHTRALVSGGGRDRTVSAMNEDVS